uniref:Venom protein n=1 Tax=Hemiscolopendra marginata TaxID=943146 RepID=A0A646QDA2_9MYRI
MYSGNLVQIFLITSALLLVMTEKISCRYIPHELQRNDVVNQGLVPHSHTFRTSEKLISTRDDENDKSIPHTVAVERKNAVKLSAQQVNSVEKVDNPPG